ncbi:MAG TPA: hypothetical protein VMU95_28150 [Trebonia sp.]|nr:hypothetical protein [Trebonia sp.]
MSAQEKPAARSPATACRTMSSISAAMAAIWANSSMSPLPMRRA